MRWGILTSMPWAGETCRVICNLNSIVDRCHRFKMNRGHCHNFVKICCVTSHSLFARKADSHTCNINDAHPKDPSIPNVMSPHHSNSQLTWIHVDIFHAPTPTIRSNVTRFFAQVITRNTLQKRLLRVCFRFRIFETKKK